MASCCLARGRKILAHSRNGDKSLHPVVPEFRPSIGQVNELLYSRGTLVYLVTIAASTPLFVVVGNGNGGVCRQRFDEFLCLSGFAN